MFTITQSVENATSGAVTLAPYGAIARRGEPDGVGFYILHEGALGMFDGELSEVDYDDIRDLPVSTTELPTGRTSIDSSGRNSNSRALIASISWVITRSMTAIKDRSWP